MLEPERPLVEHRWHTRYCNESKSAPVSIARARRSSLQYAALPSKCLGSSFVPYCFVQAGAQGRRAADGGHGERVRTRYAPQRRRKQNPRITVLALKIPTRACKYASISRDARDGLPGEYLGIVQR